MALVSIEESVELLRADQVVAIPTETVYGLAGRIRSETALKSIFTTKARPFFDPLIVHVSSIEQARSITSTWPKAAEILAKRFWPGPLTLILPKTKDVNPLITSGLDTVGVRWPRHPMAQEILRRLGEPLAAPSANRFGRTSPTTAQHVEREFGQLVPVVDGGACEVGIESTVVRWQPTASGAAGQLEILRPGIILEQQLRDALGDIPVVSVSSAASPGHLPEHYQPRLPLVLLSNATELGANQVERIAAHLGCAPKAQWLKLSSLAPLAARELYSKLHELSDQGEGFIAFAQPESWLSPEWAPLRDRLTRAAAKIWQ